MASSNLYWLLALVLLITVRAGHHRSVGQFEDWRATTHFLQLQPIHAEKQRPFNRAKVANYVRDERGSKPVEGQVGCADQQELLLLCCFGMLASLSSQLVCHLHHP